MRRRWDSVTKSLPHFVRHRRNCVPYSHPSHMTQAMCFFLFRVYNKTEQESSVLLYMRKRRDSNPRGYYYPASLAVRCLRPAQPRFHLIIFYLSTVSTSLAARPAWRGEAPSTSARPPRQAGPTLLREH